LREEYGIDLKDVPDGQLKSIGPWIGDGEKLVTLLWHFCQEQAAERDVKPEKFGKLLTGGCLREAAPAVVEAMADFSLGSEMAATLANNLRAEIKRIDGLGAELVTKAFDRARSKRSAGNSAGSSESTPALSP
jgi:hypothetical protein